MNRAMMLRTRGFAVVATSLLLASACSSDEGSATEDPLTATTPTTVSTTQYVPTTSDDEGKETIADLEEQWSAKRASIVANLGLSQFGIDEDNVLIGPSRLEVDLDDCPSAWEDTAGLEPEVIKIGMTSAQTGTYSSFNDIGVGMRAYFDYVNANGGIDGRMIELVVSDDAYDAELADIAVDALLEEEAPFYVTNVGSPGALAVYQDLNAACIPQPFVVSAHPAWGDPENYPFTTGFQMSYSTEAVMWGNWIKQNLADQVPVTVGALVTDNDFGEIYIDSFERWAAANSDIVSEVTVVRHDPTSESVSEEMAELAESSPQIFISMTAGDPCISALREIEVSGIKRSAFAVFTPSVCKQPTTYLGPVGDAADGVLVVGEGLKSTLDPLYAEETFIGFTNEQLTAAGLDPANSLIGIGFSQYGWAHVEILRIASALPGGLSRSNVLLAMRGSDLDHPMLLDGVRFSTDGIDDPFFIEGAEYSRFDVEAMAWLQTGPAVDLNGSSPNCRWARSVCAAS